MFSWIDSVSVDIMLLNKNVINYNYDQTFITLHSSRVFKELTISIKNIKTKSLVINDGEEHQTS